MKSLFTPVHWMPFIWVILQAYLFLSMAIFFLKRLKILVAPIAGMEYGQVIVAGSILSGTLFICTGSTAAAFQAAKTLQYNNEQILVNTLLQFSEFFIVGVLAVGIFLFLGLLNRHLFLTSSGDTNAHDGHLAWGILTSCINIGIAIVIWFWLKDLTDGMTPEFVNFR